MALSKYKLNPKIGANQVLETEAGTFKASDITDEIADAILKKHPETSLFVKVEASGKEKQVANA